MYRRPSWILDFRPSSNRVGMKRIGFLVLVTTAILISLWTYRTADHVKAEDPVAYNDNNDKNNNNNNNAAPVSLQWDSKCSANTTYLRALQTRLGFENRIEYAERRIQYTTNDSSRASITKLDQKLFPAKLQELDVTEAPEPAQCIPELEVVIPKSEIPDTANASSILFGISTTMSRLRDLVTIREWSYWLTNGKGESNGAGLLVVLIDASKSEAQELQAILNEVGISAEVALADDKDEMAVRYLSIVPTMYKSRLNKNRKWLALCDDDTFFTSMHGLLAELDKFDSSAPLYVGALSEDIHSVLRHGSQAFGGAGVFLSQPLASTLTKLYPQCSNAEAIEKANSGWGSQGDIMVRRCIYDHSETRLSVMPGLSQLDIAGDASGFYESGNRPLSLHHFKGGMWHIAAPYEMVKMSSVLGEDSFLMRFQTTDNFIISAGYSIARYPQGIDFDTTQYERTFGAVGDDNGYNFDYVFGPQRMNLSRTGRKIGWQLVETVLEKNGDVKQVYFRKKDDERWKKEGEESEESSENDLDGVLVLIWARK